MRAKNVDYGSFIAGRFIRRPRLRDTQRSRLWGCDMPKFQYKSAPVTRLFAVLAASWAVSIVVLLTQCTPA